MTQGMIGQPSPDWVAAFGPAPAANDASETLGAEIVDQVLSIPVDQIDRGERLRAIDEVWAGALGQLMRRDGQNVPIEVCRLPGANRWTLVAGGHRHRGAELAGIEELRAIVVTANRDQRRLREVNENLWRRDLDPVDRAAFVAEAVAILKRRAGVDPDRDGRVASVAARWQKQVKAEATDTTVTMTGVYGFTDQVAGQLGLSASSIERDLALYRRLAASVVVRLRDARHPILGNAAQLRALAKLDGTMQTIIAARLCATVVNGKPITTVAQALALAAGNTKPAADPAAKRLNTFLGAFTRMSVADRKGALSLLREHLPAGFQLVEGDAPAATFPIEHSRYREETLQQIDTARELMDGLIEDEVVSGERAALLEDANMGLRMARFTVAGNGFELAGPAS
jgi:hypothetical protein